MTGSAPRLILASGSPRRRELLTPLGIPFAVQCADIDESVLPDESPSAYALRVAAEKAEKVFERFPDSTVIGADTIVVLGDVNGVERILGKPLDDADAERMLRELRNREHQVLTAYSIRGPGGRKRDNIVCTIVGFDWMSDDDIRRYISTGEPRDKAGSYAIQGAGGVFVKRIVGSYSNVVGLPVAEVYADLRALGVVPS